MELTKLEKQVFEALLKEVESSVDDKGVEWGTVYLDNVDHGLDSQRSFSGVLSSLTQKGFYRPLDYAFGEVKITEHNKG